MMAADEARIFLRGLGCPHCLSHPDAQRPGLKERFLCDSLDSLTSDDAPVQFLDALAEFVEAGKVVVV
jgi:hypothetical protein